MIWKIGRALIGLVPEQTIQAPLALLTDDEAFLREHAAYLPDTMLDMAAGTIPLCFQSWIIRMDGVTILVDPCNGNGRKRPGFPHFEDLDLPWLERLEAMGVTPDAVDYVFCSHLHCDHCGWNTKMENGRYVPTFPNAVYIFTQREYDRWDGRPVEGSSDAAAYNSLVFEESVQPVVDAGLARLVTPPTPISDHVWIEAAPGHTQGHAVLFLDTGDGIACFSGDSVHHPLQIARPELHLPGCDSLDQAIATRRDLFARLAREGSFLFPAHFGFPHHGTLENVGGALRLRPGGAALTDGGALP